MFSKMLHLVALALLPAALADRTIILNNNCPADVALVVSATTRGTLPRQSVTTMTVPNTFNGSFYSTTNGGSGTGRLVTAAAFHLDGGYYYLFKDPSHFNMGVSIAPHAVPSNGLCVEALCDNINCDTAFLNTQQPTSFPPPSSNPPSLPLFQCPGDNTGFTVTFCPSGAFPSAGTNSFKIHPQNDESKCLDVRGGTLANETPVQIFDCNGSAAQNWNINPGSTKVQLAGTNFCLDAGSTPANAVGMKIWECFDNLPAQQWFLTDDNRIALEGQGLCLDLTNGVLTNGNQVQTWQCTDNDVNQAWLLSA